MQQGVSGCRYGGWIIFYYDQTNEVQLDTVVPHLMRMVLIYYRSKMVGQSQVFTWRLLIKLDKDLSLSSVVCPHFAKCAAKKCFCTVASYTVFCRGPILFPLIDQHANSVSHTWFIKKFHQILAVPKEDNQMREVIWLRRYVLGKAAWPTISSPLSD